MDIVVHEEVEEFARLARPLFDTDPLRHTIALTVLDGLSLGAFTATALMTVQDGTNAVVGAVLRTVGRPVLVSGLAAEHAASVAEALARVDPETTGASGPIAEVEAFGVAFAERCGAEVHIDMRMRLFALDQLAVPVGVPGSARLGVEADCALLGHWRAEMSAEARGGWTDPLTPVEVVARSLRTGAGELLWEVDGTAVAQASVRRPVAGMSRIGPVYTVPKHRGHGFGAAVTAAASRWALDAGAEQVVLFTDLANPTTNALYPRLGYRPVHDAMEVSFRTGA